MRSFHTKVTTEYSSDNLKPPNRCHVIRDQTLKLIRSIVDRVAVVRRLTRAERVAILPVQIARHGRRVQRRLLPRLLQTAVVRRDTILLEQTRLSGRLARRSVRADPAVAPWVGNAPYIMLSAGDSIRLDRKGGEGLQLSGYRWKVPKSMVGMAKFFAKSDPSEYW